MPEKSEEVNYKKNFCEKYFDKGTWDLDVLNQVDVLLKDKRENILLYIESKYKISNESSRRQGLAQTILTNKKQKSILNRVALIYQDNENNDVLELIDCSDNSVMYNNDINWTSEKPSNPSKDAIDRINDRIKGRITFYVNDEIKEFYKKLKNGLDVEIDITENNFNVVYNQWKNEIQFKENISDEQDLINLFLVDILNGTKYKKTVYVENALIKDTEQELIHEGTNLSHYEIIYSNEKIRILYEGKENSVFYTISDSEKYAFFWKKYKRPPEKNEFLKILERSATLYSEKYRRDTGGEYTPSCFVEKQVEILNKNYNMDDFIVCDPCAGVGNLENQFGKDFKHYCYLSTLEQMDVDICKIKGFENSVQFDYLKNDEQPKWKYKGTLLDINEICKRENRKLMIIMNPPYQQKAGFKYDLVIEFFIKALKLNPSVIVYYTKMEFFLRDTVSVFTNSGYGIVSHIFSNAADTFLLSNWAVSQVIFDKNSHENFTGEYINVNRYEYNKKTKQLDFFRSYTYNNKRSCLIKEIEQKIKENNSGLRIGQWTNQNYCVVLSNRQNSTRFITTSNIKYALLLKGINFNTHARYFETSNLTYKGNVNDINNELFNDSVLFSLFYKGNNFSNKEGQKNYIMPFTAGELGCNKNDLNVLFPLDELIEEQDLFSEKEPVKPFDFRLFLKEFNFSKESKDLYSAALEIFKYYHKAEEFAKNRDWNDSFYDITNVIMGKDASCFQEFETEKDKRITKVKTAKGTRGFGRSTIKYVVSSASLPIFEHFFEVRDILAKKINKQLVEQGLLLWERENIY